MKLAFVIPCYCSSLTIKEVINGLEKTVRSSDDYEIICVNDSSRDNTLEVLRSIVESDDKVRAIDLASNSGQHCATIAGYRHVSDDVEVVVTLDDDGQSPPEEFYKLVDALDETHDVVFAAYGRKKQSAFRNMGSRVAGWMLHEFVGAPRGVQQSSYFAAKRFVIEEVVRYESPYPFLQGLIDRATDGIGDCRIGHRERVSGQSGYTLRKLFSLWLNGFTSFSIKPLRVASFTGIFLAIIGFIFGVFIIIRKLLDSGIPAGYTSTMAVLLFIGGVILMALGMLGEYVGRVFISLNNAPQYVVRQTYGFDNKERGDIGEEMS